MSRILIAGCNGQLGHDCVATLAARLLVRDVRSDLTDKFRLGVTLEDPAVGLANLLVVVDDEHPNAATGLHPRRLPSSRAPEHTGTVEVGGSLSSEDTQNAGDSP